MTVPVKFSAILDIFGPGVSPMLAATLLLFFVGLAFFAGLIPSIALRRTGAVLVSGVGAVLMLGASVVASMMGVDQSNLKVDSTPMMKNVTSQGSLGIAGELQDGQLAVCTTPLLDRRVTVWGVMMNPEFNASSTCTIYPAGTILPNMNNGLTPANGTPPPVPAPSNPATPAPAPQSNVPPAPTPAPAPVPWTSVPSPQGGYGSPGDIVPPPAQVPAPGEEGIAPIRGDGIHDGGSAVPGGGEHLPG